MDTDMELIRYHFSGFREQFTLPEDMYEGWVILSAQSGRFAFRFDEEGATWEEAEFGDLVICPPGKRLQRKTLEKLSFHFIEWRGDGHWLPGKMSIHDVGRLGSTYAYLREWQEQHAEERSKQEAVHLIRDLLYLARRETEKARQRKNEKADPLMRQAAAYIEQHLGMNDLSLQALALKLGVADSQLTRRFRAAYGMTPIRYATAVRLAKARRLLVDTEDTLDIIAEQCGYQNAFYFSRVFTQHMQTSPSAYRRAYRV
ncbi:helix-turn-helix domain-containing protein [Paenibacillus thalictri]|uniref:AraC family transcriptional regulator n=1 Tax=Paenibacillus thalictri TaxID=2527873 RepID=A0A4Q9DM68_9BACL|nr:AraC family transcriptional regulator [Paenibacillus thalictri]TBL74560.1 AraC family transcriptional regulator [Paenibacillus thalictri]